MTRSVFGWDLPPGVSTRDLPGNSPEDETWEVATEAIDKMLADAKLTPDEAVMAVRGGIAFVVANRTQLSELLKDMVASEHQALQR